MKKIDKIILVLFSVIIFLQSILLICVITGIVNFTTVERFVTLLLYQDKASKIVLAIALICLICSLKAIFFSSSDQPKSKSGILMQNDNGKLLISKATIENIVMSAVQGFNSITDVSVSTELDNFNNLIVNVNLVVSSNVVIKELTLSMQNKIKEEIKKTSDLDVKEVNVKITNIATEQNNTNQN